MPCGAAGVFVKLVPRAGIVFARGIEPSTNGDAMDVGNHPALVRARDRHRLAWSDDATEQHYLARCRRGGLLVSPIRHAFALPDEWRELSDAERTNRIIFTVADMHPEYVFSSTTAAYLLGLDDSYALQRRVHVARSRGAAVSKPDHGLVHVHTVLDPARDLADLREAQGCRVLHPERVLLDCARDLRFSESLPIWDAAFREGLVEPGSMKAFMDRCSELQRRTPGIRLARLLLKYASGRSENGGESRARAAMLELGFAAPEVQRTFRDPSTRREIRPDFLWRVAPGRTIAGELDGMRKYKDESMRGGRDVEDVLIREKDRETALNMLGILVVRFGMSDVFDRVALQNKLAAIGVPHVDDDTMTERMFLREWRGQRYPASDILARRGLGTE